MSGLDRAVGIPEGVFLGCPRGVAFLAEAGVKEDVVHQARAEFPITAVIGDDGNVFLYVNVIATVTSYRELAGEGGATPSIEWLMEEFKRRKFALTLMNVYEGALSSFEDAVRFFVGAAHGIPLEEVPMSFVQDVLEQRTQRSKAPLFIGAPTREDLPRHSISADRCTCGLG